MASIAPFGTDVQPPIQVKILGGKLTYVSNESKELRVTSEEQIIADEFKETANNADSTVATTPNTDDMVKEERKDSTQDSNVPLISTLSDSELVDILSDCHSRSITTGVIDKQKLFKILQSKGVSDESITMLIAFSNCSIDQCHIDYVKFVTTLRDVVTKINGLSRGTPTDKGMRRDSPEGILSAPCLLVPGRLLKSCPPELFLRSNSKSTLDPVTPDPLRPHTDGITSLARHTTKKDEGLPHLYAALRKCSTITDKIDKSHAIRIIKLYNSVYNMDLPILQIEAFVATKRDGECLMMLVDTEELLGYIRSVI